MEQPYETNHTRPYEDDLEKGIKREECAICLDNTELTYNTWVQLKVCSHAFHKSCIDLWLSTHTKSLCPLCQRDICQQQEINNHIVVFPERRMTIRREVEEKCLCFILCLCCLAVFIVPPVMMFVGKK